MKHLNFIEFIDYIVKTQQVFHSILEGNEAQTRWLLIDPVLLTGLGYSREDIIVEYNLENKNADRYNRLDYSILINNKPKLLIEAKSLGINLYEKYAQLEEYFMTVLGRYSFEKGELIGVLTDGDKYLFYTNSLNENRMDKRPFYTIQLSVSEDFEKQKLLTFHKNNIVKQKLIKSDEEYELGVSYRIDMIDSVLNYFESQGIEVKINRVYFRGRMKDIKSLRTLYREVIKWVDVQNPGLLYMLASNEDFENNGKLSSPKFSLSHINSTEIVYKTNQGDIYITIPTSRTALIDRIVYLAKESNFGVQNLLLTFERK